MLLEPREGPSLTRLTAAHRSATLPSMGHPYSADDDVLQLAARSASLGSEVLAKHAGDVDARARFPEESMRALAEAGFWGLCIPAALGGKGQGPRAFAA